MLAYDFPLLSMFWTIALVFIWIAWIFLVIRVFVDIFRSNDMSGGAKAVWAIFVIVAPLLGVFVYVLVRGRAMNERDIAEAQRSEDAIQAYIRNVAGGTGTADELAKLAGLRDRGVITEAEFAAQKAKILG